MEEEQETDHGGGERTQRGEAAQGQQRVLEGHRGPPGAGDAHEEHARHVVDEGVDRLAGGAEIAAEAEVDGSEGAVEEVGLQIRGAMGDDKGIMGEQAHDPGRAELSGKGDDEAEAEAERHGRPHGLLCLPGLAGPEVLAGDRADRAQHGRRHQEKEADHLLDDTDGGGVDDTPPVDDHGDEQERDLDEAVLQADRKADAEDFPSSLPIRFQIRKRQRDGAAPNQPKEGKDDTDTLADHGGQGRAAGSLSKRSDQEPVQKDIEDAGDGDKDHGGS